MVAFSFNASQFEPRYGGGGGGLPAGPNGEKVRYKVILSAVDRKPAKSGKGDFMELELKCIEGPQSGKSQTDRLNLWNVDAQTVEIANKQLSAYCHAIGQFVVNDTNELLNKPFVVEIGMQDGSDKYTEVKAVFDINNNEPGKASHAAPAQPQQAPPPQQPPPQTAPPPAQGGGWGGPGANAGGPAPQWQPPAAEAPQQPPAPPQAGWGGSAPANPPGWGR